MTPPDWVARGGAADVEEEEEEEEEEPDVPAAGRAPHAAADWEPLKIEVPAMLVPSQVTTAASPVMGSGTAAAARNVEDQLPVKLLKLEVTSSAATSPEGGGATTGGETPAVMTPREGAASAVAAGEDQVAAGVHETPSKLELPVKLLRLGDSCVQMAQCEQEPDDTGLSNGFHDLADMPERSLSLPDAWSSPFMQGAGLWAPWLGFGPGMESPPGLPESALGLEPLAESYVAGVGCASSALHAAGKCRPCAWYWKPGSCQNADNCSYCHLCPEGELKARKKAKVAMMRLGIVTPKAKTSSEQEAAGNVLRLSSLL